MGVYASLVNMAGTAFGYLLQAVRAIGINKMQIKFPVFYFILFEFPAKTMLIVLCCHQPPKPPGNKKKVGFWDRKPVSPSVPSPHRAD